MQGILPNLAGQNHDGGSAVMIYGFHFIVFRIGFHDFRVFFPSHKSQLPNIPLCHLPSGIAGQTF